MSREGTSSSGQELAGSGQAWQRNDLDADISDSSSSSGEQQPPPKKQNRGTLLKRGVTVHLNRCCRGGAVPTPLFSLHFLQQNSS